MKGKRAAALLLVLFVFMLLFSLLFMIEEANHECTNGDCPICRVFCVVEKSLKKAALPLYLAAIAAAVQTFAFRILVYRRRIAFLATPVLLKVKLSD